jgi:cytoskeletal protein CcmA (bactofilin family)
MSDAPDDLGIPMKPARTQPAGGNIAPLGRVLTATPPRAPEPVRVLGEPPRPADSQARAGTASASRQPEDARKLIVGREISLSGEINSCDRLMIEGSVEANLQNCHDIDIAESGLFKGSATVEEADIHGRFEGHITVRGRLFIRASGRVSGTIRYGQIEIECGGQISGDIQAQASDGLASDAVGARAAF